MAIDNTGSLLIPKFSYHRAATADWTPMRTVDLMNRIAETDSTFTLDVGRWRGKCLICNGWLSFDARTGFGANIEHIYPRSLGGDNTLLNLSLTHPRCNGEKGRNWDPKRRHRTDPERYRALVEQLLRRRQERWREGRGA